MNPELTLGKLDDILLRKTKGYASDALGRLRSDLEPERSDWFRRSLTDAREGGGSFG